MEEKRLNYKDLEIYQLAHELAVTIHKMSLSLPRVEAYEEACQIRRSSKSICSNIVEGFCRRRYKQEFIRFLTFAWGSCEETMEHLRLLRDTGSLQVEAYAELELPYQTLSSKIYRFVQSVEREHRV